jgi:TonB family protein
MNCNDVAAILDHHRSAGLSAAERSAVDQHLCACNDCAAAWHAQNELLALRVPAASTALHDTVLAAIAGLVAARPQPRRARGPIVIGGVLLAGAALAAVTLVTVTRAPDDAAPGSVAAPAAAPSAPAADAQSTAPDAASPQPDELPTSVELVEIALTVAPLAIRPPDYPPDALTRRLEGHVQLKFDVTTSGKVENISVVESSDPVFEDSAVRAITTWRYLPRIAAGKRVVSPGVHTILRFALAPEPATANPPERQAGDDAAQAAQRTYTEFSAGIEVALDRFAVDDLRGAELQLDEMYAVYDNDGRRGALWNFYGYLYTVDGNYDRAIDAYEEAIAANGRAGSPWVGQWVPLANLYFARHQYDMALRTLLTHKGRIAEANARYPARPPQPVAGEVERFIERLRALGVTEETLSPSR